MEGENKKVSNANDVSTFERGGEGYIPSCESLENSGESFLRIPEGEFEERSVFSSVDDTPGNSGGNP